MEFYPAYNNGPHPDFGSTWVEHVRGIRNTDDVTGEDLDLQTA